MRRTQSIAEAQRGDIPGGNQHALALELCKTIDDAASTIGKAVNDLEARLESIEDTLRLIASRLYDMRPI